MRVPLAWLRDYVQLPANPHEVAGMLASLGFPVDALEERPTITGVLAGRIETLEKHPNADRLQVGTVNVGNGALLTIATAATNVAQGQTIAVATVGARLPQLTIERRKMRGVQSEGMMISADELALPSEWFEDGIMQFDAALEPGSDVVERFGLSEAVLDVDVTSNRVDAMSLVGLARELAAYQGVPLRMPALDYAVVPDGAQPLITIETPDCRRFVAQRFTGVRVEQSPAWIRIRLALAGQRPINNLVDISNFVMFETGQPLHFYDDDGIPNHHLIVRDAREGERLITLDGEEHDLTANDLVIASETGAEGLAGLMGGRRSEVTEKTSALLLESANFTGARIRRMSARRAFRTEASSRHEKALPLALTDLGQERAAHLLVAQGAQAHAPVAFGDRITSGQPIDVPLRDIKRLLGYELGAPEAIELLDRLGFTTAPHDADTITVTPPLWRRDVTNAADVIEELARLAGYDRIEALIPAVAQHDISGEAYEREQRIAQSLCALGYQEIVSVALHGSQVLERLERAGAPAEMPPVQIRNPLSEEQRYLRFSLIPGLLHYLAQRSQPVRIFEIGHVFHRQANEPAERAGVAFAFSAEALDEPRWRDSHFLRLKGDAHALMQQITGRRDFTYEAQQTSGAHPGKTAAMLLDRHEVAVICQVDPRLQAAFDVPFPVYACWSYLERIPPYRWPAYQPRAKYPSTYRDIALVCDTGVPAAELESIIRSAIGPLCTEAKTFDEYRGSQIPQGKKSLAVRVTLQKTDGTITDAQADAAIDIALKALRERADASLRT